MDNVTIFVDELDGTEYAIINKGGGLIISMFKSAYDEMIANETPSV
jgi:hypothetical protein